MITKNRNAIIEIVNEHPCELCDASACDFLHVNIADRKMCSNWKSRDAFQDIISELLIMKALQQ
jgi:hypothetical protein